MRRTNDQLQLIEKTMQSKSRIIVFASKSTASRQDLYLCEYTTESFLGGQPVPAGSYLLADKRIIRTLTHARQITVLSEDPITAHVLNYYERNTDTIVLDDSADLLVTPRLTGCSIAAELNTDNPTLLHLNRLKTVPTSKDDCRVQEAIDQKVIDAEIAETMAGRACFTFKKAEYMSSNDENTMSAATFMAFRDSGGGWRYRTQVATFNLYGSNSPKLAS